MLQHLDLHGGETVLDVGCGAGQHFAALRTAVGMRGRVIGIDYSPGMVKQAQELVEQQGWDNVEVRRGDASQPALEQPDLAQHDVDAAIATFAISAMPDLYAALQNVRDALRPGGQFFVIDLCLVPKGPAGIVVRFLGLCYRLLAGWTGQDVLTALQETFDTVQVIRGGRSWVVIAVATTGRHAADWDGGGRRPTAVPPSPNRAGGGASRGPGT
jgi:SAM-dependent methyltransferase